MMRRSDQSSASDESEPTSHTSNTSVLSTPNKSDSPQTGVSFKRDKVSDFCLRIAVLGDSLSCKRNLIFNFLTGGMSTTQSAQESLFEAISGLSFTVVHFNCAGFTVRLQIYDQPHIVTGERAYSAALFSGSDALMVVYDIEDRKSFENACNWLEVINYYKYKKTVFLVANNWEKSLVNRRNVTKEEGQKVAHEQAAFYYDMSSLPEIRSACLNMFDVFVRYGLYDLIKKESVIAIPVETSLDESQFSSQMLEKITAIAASSSPSSVSESVDSPTKKLGGPGGGAGVFQIFSRAGKRGNQALFSAVQGKDVSFVRSALSSSKNLGATRDPSTRSTLLMMCASNCNSAADLEIAELLFDSVDKSEILDTVNAQNNNGDTAIMCVMSNSASRETEEFCSMILKSNPDLTVKNNLGCTAFHFAAENNYASFFRRFADSDAGLPAEAFQTNNAEETPAYLAAKNGNHEVVKLLLEDDRVMEMLHCTALQYTFLHAAVLAKSVRCAEAILERRPRCVNATNKELYTAIYLAMELEHVQLRDMLVRYGGDPRIGKTHRKMQQMIKTVFVPGQISWCSSQRIQRLNLSNCDLDVIPVAVFQMKWLTHLDMSRCRLEVLPRSICELSDLEELNLSDNLLRSISMDVLALEKLRVFSLDGNPKIAGDLSALVLSLIGKLGSLDLSRLNLTDLSMDLLSKCTHLSEIILNENALSHLDALEMPELKNLWIGSNKLTEFPRINGFPSLELLNLSGNQITSVAKLENSGLSELREIWLESNELKEFPLSFCDRFKGLKRVWLDDNAISHITECDFGVFEGLQCFSLNRNQLEEVPPSFAVSLNGLQKLWIEGNLIQQLPSSFTALTSIQTLCLAENPLRVFPVQVASLVSLKELMLNDCGLGEIDAAIGNLTNLKKLSLKNNRLKFLPQTIGFLTNLTLLDVSGNVDLTSPPPETVKGGTESIVGFLKDLVADSQPSYRMKLMIVGQEAVGKTSLLRCIMGKKKSKFGTKRTELSTDGIDIEQWERKVKMGNKVVKANFRAWDFAGQEVYYSTHAFFLSNRSIYVVVWSMLFGEDQQRIPYWLQSIQSRSPKAPVLLIGTHAENMETTYISEYSQRVMEKFSEKFPNLSIVGFTAVSCQTGLNVKVLQEKIDAATVNQPFMGEPLPTIYLTLENAVLHERKRVPPVMSWEEFKKLGVGIGLLREDELIRATSLLHEMGTLFLFKPPVTTSGNSDSSSSSSERMVVLDPQWLTKMMSQVITTKANFVKDGIFMHKNTPFVWKAPEYPSHLHSHLLQLLQSFDVSFRMDNEADLYAGKSLIPVMLPSHSNGGKFDNRALAISGGRVWNLQLGRIFDFYFLPAGFFGRLIVRLLYLSEYKQLYSDFVRVKKGNAEACVSVANMTIEVRVMSCAKVSPDALTLLKITVQNLENLAEDWFQIRAKTQVPCVHCIDQGKARPYLFDVEECEQAASAGMAYVSCCGQYPVALNALCPDITVSADIPVVRWNQVKDQVRVGEGTFAYVYKAIMALDDGRDAKVVAVKKLIDESDFRELRKEAGNLMSLKHKNVVELFGVCFKPPALVAEFMEQGSLFEYLQSEKVKTIPWKLRIQFMLDIASGMNFLHTTTPPVLHRDLKSANVLLNAQLTAKISDFGTVTLVAPYTTGRIVTNPRWLAPEVLSNQPYGASSDVYGYGITMWEICTREVPFTDKPSYAWAHNVEDDVCKGERPVIPDYCTDELGKLIQACWEQTPDLRPSFEKVLRVLHEMDMSELLELDEDDLNKSLRRAAEK